MNGFFGESGKTNSSKKNVVLCNVENRIYEDCKSWMHENGKTNFYLHGRDILLFGLVGGVMLETIAV